MTFDQAADKISRAIGHAIAIPLSAMIIAGIYVASNIDITNFTISVVSLLLLFLLQHTQNRDGLAIQVKLDELIRTSNARNELVGIDKQSEKEIEQLRELN